MDCTLLFTVVVPNLLSCVCKIEPFATGPIKVFTVGKSARLSGNNIANGIFAFIAHKLFLSFATHLSQCVLLWKALGHRIVSIFLFSFYLKHQRHVLGFLCL